jgi:hypothetical protein
MDPSDGLLYAVKQGVAKLVLCALPSSGRATLKQKRPSCKNRAAEDTLNGEEPGMGNEMEMSKFKADQVRQAVCKHCFRIPGASSPALLRHLIGCTTTGKCCIDDAAVLYSIRHTFADETLRLHLMRIQRDACNWL